MFWELHLSFCLLSVLVHAESAHGKHQQGTLGSPLTTQTHGACHAAAQSLCTLIALYSSAL